MKLTSEKIMEVSNNFTQFVSDLIDDAKEKEDDEVINQAAKSYGTTALSLLILAVYYSSLDKEEKKNEN